MNEYAVYAASAMQVSLGGPGELSFSWVTAADLDFWSQGECSHSCAIGHDAFSRSAVLYHELAHALYYDVKPRASPFLQEGFATALDPFQLANFMNVSQRDPRSLLTATSLSAGYYAVAGMFISYLLQVHGVEKFRTLYQTIPEESSLADWRSAFETIYGATLDEVVEAYINTTVCPQDVEPFPQFECQAPLLPSDGLGWTYERVLNCEDEDVAGGVESDNGLATTLTIEVDTPGEYAVEFLAPSASKSLLRIGSCDRCRWLPNETRFGGGQTVSVDLEPGRHFMSVRIFDIQSSDVQVRITRLFE